MAENIKPEMPMFSKTLAEAQASGSVEVSALPMKRRHFLSRLAAVPLVAQLIVEGKTVSAATKLEPGHYLLFVDPKTVNIEDLVDAAAPLPKDCFIQIITVKLQGEQTMDDAVRLYQVKDA
jgi:hypothetical protein